MTPATVAPLLALARRRGLGIVAVEPAADLVVVVLLGPHHPGERLALHGPRIRVDDVALQRAVERVGLATALREDGVDVPQRRTAWLARQPHAGGDLGPGRDHEATLR